MDVVAIFEWIVSVCKMSFVVLNENIGKNNHKICKQRKPQ